MRGHRKGGCAFFIVMPENLCFLCRLCENLFAKFKTSPPCVCAGTRIPPNLRRGTPRLYNPKIIYANLFHLCNLCAN